MAVRWRKNDDDAKMDEERLKGELVSMNKSCKEKLDMEERVLVPKRAHITREGLEVVITRGDGERQAHAENSRRRIEEERHCEGGSSKKARERGERKERNRAQRKDRRMHKQQHQRQRQRQRQLQRVRAVAARPLESSSSSSGDAARMCSERSWPDGPRVPSPAKWRRVVVCLQLIAQVTQ